MVGTSSDKETYQESNNHNPNNKLNTFRTTHTRWNSDTQIIANNIPHSTQLHKRDEWREDSSISSSPPSSPALSLSSSPPSPYLSNNNNTNSSNHPRKRLSVSTSFQQPLDPQHPKSDRFSISKLLAQRRASAPIVSHAQLQERKNAQHVIAQHNNAHAVPREPRVNVARSKGASVEVYGFVCWITTFVAYAFYLLWGFMPKQLLQSLGVHYFPNRYWVVAIPSYVMVAILFGILTYVCFNLINTPSLDSFHTFSADVTPEHYRQEHENSIPVATDIPLTLVNELLYQKRKASELSPTFPKFGNAHTTRSRVFFDNKNKKSAEDLRGDWDASFSSNESAESDGEDMRGGGSSSSSSSYHEYPKRTLRSYSPFSSSSDSSPIRRTSSYSLLKEENM